MFEFKLSRNLAGKLVLTTADGMVHEGVVPVRAFPVAAPDFFVAIMSLEGKEIAWIDDLQKLPEDTRQYIQDEIASRELIPEILSIVSVSTFSTPSDWEVTTDKGRTKFTLKGEEDIRRLSTRTLLITDSHGLRFYLKDMQTLDKNSRKILDRFL
ncbi:uncharacterized protein DUF1854 [Jezberella montanilacus]|jgi:hypothetical protein|uniref:Uncharacterized protein DUF1854 n=1 Tax=Jezberella montanilacus TaxID=323426 RepID=A0A2T0XKB1_9BURK|nr:DUF1854 domain-containing protein [Jezberella montanilacus]PRY99373.1 uncharacterized protein DUF1854 [Jezberella montanilacus]